jgi:hypothetical protein
MWYESNGKRFEVRQSGSRFFYFSSRALRWLPVAQAQVKFS